MCIVKTPIEIIKILFYITKEKIQFPELHSCNPCALLEVDCGNHQMELDLCSSL